MDCSKGRSYKDIYQFYIHIILFISIFTFIKYYLACLFHFIWLSAGDCLIVISFYDIRCRYIDTIHHVITQFPLIVNGETAFIFRK